MDDNDFLFTWKPEKWPYENLRKLVDAFDAGNIVVEPWRCQAHQKVRPGARAYLLKQGTPRGIFGVAEVIGIAAERDDAKAGEGRYAVPLRFELLVDPAKRFLVTDNDLNNLPVPHHRWDTQGSGVTFEAAAARMIDQLVKGERRTAASTIETRRERLIEVCERDQALVEELKDLYQGCCQICASAPFNGHFGRIVEGHHLEWLSRGGQDLRNNLVILCPNHHSAVHAVDPVFDRKRLEFRFGPKVVPIRLDRHLRPIS